MIFLVDSVTYTVVELIKDLTTISKYYSLENKKENYLPLHWDPTLIMFLLFVISSIIEVSDHLCFFHNQNATISLQVVMVMFAFKLAKLIKSTKNTITQRI